MNHQTAILRHQTTNTLYRHNHGDNYTNLHTGASGDISPEQAKRIFKINIEATAIFNQNPILEDLIRKLNLVLDVENKTVPYPTTL